MATNIVELLVKVVDQASKELDGINKSAQTLGQDMQKVGGNLTKGLTLPLVGAAGAALKLSTDFNASMANVQTLIPGSTERVEELADAVQDMAVATGKSTADLSEGLYQVVSAFGDSADSSLILEQAARAAAAGLATTQDALGLTSAVTKAYGDTSVEAQKQVQDLAFQAVKLGETTFPELAASIGRVTPIVQSLGASQEELFAVMATATGVTGGAAEVSTQLRGAMQALLAPTADTAKLLEDMGLASGQALIEQEGLQGAISTLVQAAEDSGEPLQKFIGSIEGQTLALVLAGSQSDTYQEKLAAMGDASGAADEAFRAQTEGVNANGFAMQQLRQLVITTAQDLGASLAPALTSVIEVLKPMLENVAAMADRFSKADPAIQAVVVGGLALAAAIGPLITVMGSLITSVGAISAAMGGAGLLASLGAVIPVVGAVAAAGAALALAWRNNFGGIRDVVAEVGPQVQLALQGIGQAFERLAFYGAELFDNVLKPVIVSLEPLFSGVFNAIGTVVLYALAVIEEVVSAVASLLAGDFRGAFESATNAVTLILEGLARAIWEILSTLPETMLNLGGDIINGLVNGLRGGIDLVTGAVTGVAESLMGTFKRLLGIASPSLFGFETGVAVGDGISGGLISTVAIVESAAKDVTNAIKKAFDKMIEEDLSNWITTLTSQLELGFARSESVMGTLAHKQRELFMALQEEILKGQAGSEAYLEIWQEYSQVTATIETLTASQEALAQASADAAAETRSQAADAAGIALEIETAARVSEQSLTDWIRDQQIQRALANAERLEAQAEADMIAANEARALARRTRELENELIQAAKDSEQSLTDWIIEQQEARELAVAESAQERQSLYLSRQQLERDLEAAARQSELDFNAWILEQQQARLDAQADADAAATAEAIAQDAARAKALLTITQEIALATRQSEKTLTDWIREQQIQRGLANIERLEAQAIADAEAANEARGLARRTRELENELTEAAKQTEQDLTDWIIEQQEAREAAVAASAAERKRLYQSRAQLERDLEAAARQSEREFNAWILEQQQNRADEQAARDEQATADHKAELAKQTGDFIDFLDTMNAASHDAQEERRERWESVTNAIIDNLADVLNILMDVASIDYSDGNAILEGIGAAAGEIVGMIPGLEKFGPIIQAASQALSAFLGDMSNGAKQVREQLDQLATDSLVNFEQLPSMIQGLVQRESRGGFLGFLGFTKQVLNEEMLAYAQSVADALSGGFTAGFDEAASLALGGGSLDDITGALYDGTREAVEAAILAGVRSQVILAALGPLLTQLTADIVNGVDPGATIALIVGALPDLAAGLEEALGPIGTMLEVIFGENLPGGTTKTEEALDDTTDAATDLADVMATMEERLQTFREIADAALGEVADLFVDGSQISFMMAEEVRGLLELIEAATMAGLDTTELQESLDSALADMEDYGDRFASASQTLTGSLTNALKQGIETGDWEGAAHALDEQFRNYVIDTILDMAVQAALASSVVAQRMADLTYLIEEAVATGDWSAVQGAVSDIATDLQNVFSGVSGAVQGALADVFGGGEANVDVSGIETMADALGEAAVNVTAPDLQQSLADHANATAQTFESGTNALADRMETLESALRDQGAVIQVNFPNAEINSELDIRRISNELARLVRQEVAGL